VLQGRLRACIAHLRLPFNRRKVIRTTNLLERLFGEERRRTKVIANFFGERPVLKLMYAALIRASDQWRRITISQFEGRQLQTIRQELDDAHRRRHAPAIKDTARKSPSGFSSNQRT
jgi:putative transposase